MGRLLVGSLVLAVGMTGVFLYQGVTRDREYRQLVADGDQALLDEQRFLAIEAYSGAIALDRDLMLAYLKRGETYRAMGDHQGALRDLSLAARLDPNATRPLEQLGDTRYSIEQYDAAADHYERFLQLDDQNARVLYKLALTQQRQDRSTRAVELLERAVVLAPRFAEAHYVLGVSLAAIERFDDARTALEQATELSPGFLVARETLADVCAALGDTRGMLRQLDVLAALDRDRPDRHITRGLAYAKAGRTDVAVVSLGRAAEEHPDQPHVYAALGEVWLDDLERSRDPVSLSKALEALQEIPLTSATSHALTVLGRALRLDGSLEESRRVLRLAVERFPVDPEAFRLLANLEDLYFNDEFAARLRGQYTRLTGQEPLPPQPILSELRPSL